MNIVFMGTPDFALATLEAIYNSKHKVLAVVSQPDKQVGRGMKITSTPTKEFAISKGIKVLQPEKIKNNLEFIEELKLFNADAFVVTAYGKILPQEVLDIPKHGCINVHGSLLPKYRGAAPIQWSIINGDKITGITTMFMDKGMDTGDMLLKEEVPIEDDDTYGTLYEKLKTLGGKLAVDTLDALENGSLERTKQPEEFTLAPMIFKEDCEIDFSKSAKDISNLVRGVNPMPGAFTKLDEDTYKIWKATAITDDEYKKYVKSLNQGEYIDTIEIEEPGVILISDSKHGLFIRTGDGVLKVLEIQAPGSKRLSINDYLRGKEIKLGNKFIKKTYEEG